MSSDDTGISRRPDEDPIVIGQGLRDVETRLRTALREDADTFRPSERLDAILTDAQAGVSLTPDDSPTRRRWLRPAAAAAAAVVVAGALWVSGRPSGAPVAPVGSPSTSVTVSQAPTTAPSSAPSAPSAPSSIPTVTGSASQPVPPQATSTTSAPADTTPRRVPVYYVGDRVPGGTSFGLFREFVSVPVDVPVTDETRTLAALQQGVAAAPTGSGYHALWGGVEVRAVSVTSSRITITLSRGATGIGGESAKLAVQQLVWTAQGAVGKGLIPVSFELADGGTEVAPGISTSGTYTQPTGPAALDEISTIWVTDPGRGSVAKAGTPVTVSGVASVFEATVQWQLLRGSAVVASRFTTATAGAPDRGTYSFKTPALTAGDYTVRVYESSAKDGSVAAEARTTFTVR